MGCNAWVMPVLSCIGDHLARYGNLSLDMAWHCLHIWRQDPCRFSDIVLSVYPFHLSLWTWNRSVW